MIAIYARYGSILKDDHQTLQDAIHSLRSIQDDGEGYGLGVYDPATKTMHIEENMDILGKGREQVLKEKLSEFQELDLQVDKIEFYKPY